MDAAFWTRHRGDGLEFRHSGAAPSDQELLDWLATEFVARGWSMKAMHRLMVTSEAYRQTSSVDEKLVAADPDNILVSRMPLHRMDAEDAVRFIADRDRPAGPGIVRSATEVTIPRQGSYR